MTVTQTDRSYEQATDEASVDLTEQDAPPAGHAERSGGASGRPTFTITEAATACGVSRKTITRKLAELALHGAAKDDDGIWRIPVEALLAVGLHPGRSLRRPEGGPRTAVASSPAAPVAAAHVDGAADVISVPRHRWDDLRIRLARAEAEASERALALADARLALRALTAGPATQSVAPALGRATQSAPAADPRPTDVPQVVAHAAPEPEPRGVVAPAPPGGAVDPAVPTPVTQQDDAEARLAAARTHAAQNGGYVPATPAAPARKRRWWQSK
jgi:hypothetical protein